MKKAISIFNPAIWIIAALLALSACAELQAPAYWLQSYPDANQSKTAQCLQAADAAYENAGGSQGRGDNGFALLAKGNAWDTCMVHHGAVSDKS